MVMKSYLEYEYTFPCQHCSNCGRHMDGEEK